MKVVIAGGTGFIGKALCDALARPGREIVVLTRQRGQQPSPRQRPGNIRYVRWLDDDEQWQQELHGAYGVINLAGASIAGGRWTPRRKELILRSRVESTRALVAAMEQAPRDRRPAVFLSGSATGYYGLRGDEPLTEAAGPGNDFLSQVCVAWEAAAAPATKLGVRTVLLRIGLVLGTGGGALPQILLPFKFFAGGPLGHGRQWWSWIHLDDVTGLIHFALDNRQVEGPLNLTAPNPVTNREFARLVGQVLGRPSWLPAPAPVLRLALGEMADALLLGGQRVLPAKAQTLGYKFQFPELLPVLKDLFTR